MAREPYRAEACPGDINVANHPGVRSAYSNYGNQRLLRNIARYASLVLRSEHRISCTEHRRAGWDKARGRRPRLRDNWHFSASRFPRGTRHITDDCNCYGPAPRWTCESTRVTSGRSYWIPICIRSEEHTSELQSRFDLVCRLLLEKITVALAARGQRADLALARGERGRAVDRRPARSQPGGHELPARPLGQRRRPGPVGRGDPGPQ